MECHLATPNTSYRLYTIWGTSPQNKIIASRPRFLQFTLTRNEKKRNKAFTIKCRRVCKEGRPLEEKKSRMAFLFKSGEQDSLCGIPTTT